jgi:hypothetical protein
LAQSAEILSPLCAAADLHLSVAQPTAKMQSLTHTRDDSMKLNCAENQIIILRLEPQPRECSHHLAALALSGALNAKWFDKATS